jgi:hypothetical protein
MLRRGNSYDEGVKECSGWLLPSAVLLSTVALCVLFLLYYLAPNPASFIEEHTSPTSRTGLVRLSVGGLALRVPENYLIYPSERRDGARHQVALFAALPDFRGYAEPDSAVFAGNGANSPIVHILIRQDAFDLTEPARLNRTYLGDVIDARGKPGPSGLTQYAFRDDSGYRGEDLFVGRAQDGIVVMRCVRKTAIIPSPNCLRELPLTKGVELSYRFKRSRLDDWRGIARGVKRLAVSFATSAK